MTVETSPNRRRGWLELPVQGEPLPPPLTPEEWEYNQLWLSELRKSLIGISRQILSGGTSLDPDYLHQIDEKLGCSRYTAVARAIEMINSNDILVTTDNRLGKPQTFMKPGKVCFGGIVHGYIIDDPEAPTRKFIYAINGIVLPEKNFPLVVTGKVPKEIAGDVFVAIGNAFYEQHHTVNSSWFMTQQEFDEGLEWVYTGKTPNSLSVPQAPF